LKRFSLLVPRFLGWLASSAHEVSSPTLFSSAISRCGSVDSTTDAGPDDVLCPWSAEVAKLFGSGEIGLGLAVFSEVGCAALLVLGLFTRFAALMLTITMAVAFFLVHKGALSGPSSGELAMLYMMGYLTLVFAGGGKFSADKS
jgi:uncharacterized membrane protein YphA (DoxX/SURF4 family)